MGGRILYLLSVVAVGWAVTFGLRALPFLLFAGRSRPLPPWVERLGAVISPVIIFGLILYSYSGLEWKTAWPYLAGALTVGLQLWRRNALVSIVAGTAVYMLLLNAGCASVPDVQIDARHPSIRVETSGVYVGGERVEVREVPKILRGNDIPRDRTVHILLAPGVTDLTEARTLMGTIAKAGYRRPVLVTARHAEAKSGPKRPKPPKRGTSAAKKKGVGER